MKQSETEKLLAHPKFRQLVRVRTRFNMLFSMIITLGYGLYVFGIVFAPGFMSRPIFNGGSITYGILSAVMVIISGMVCSGIYIWWARRRFDVMAAEVLKDTGYE